MQNRMILFINLSPMIIVYFFVLFSASSALEFGSKNASAILSRLRVSRACAYTGIALRAAHPHSSQACLAVSNPSPSSGNRIRHTPSSGARTARPRSDFSDRLTGCLRGGPQALPAEGGHARRLSLRQNKVRKIFKYPIILQRLVNNAQKLPR